MWRWWRRTISATHREHGRHRGHHRRTPVAAHARWHSSHTRSSIFQIHAFLIGIAGLPGWTFGRSIRRGGRRCHSRRSRRNLNVVVEIHKTGIVSELVSVEHRSHVPGTQGLRSTGLEPRPSGHPVIESTSTLIWYHFGGDHFVCQDFCYYFTDKWYQSAITLCYTEYELFFHYFRKV